jgi:hypothetical protein
MEKSSGKHTIVSLKSQCEDWGGQNKIILSRASHPDVTKCYSCWDKDDKQIGKEEEKKSSSKEESKHPATKPPKFPEPLRTSNKKTLTEKYFMEIGMLSDNERPNITIEDLEGEIESLNVGEDDSSSDTDIFSSFKNDKKAKVGEYWQKKFQQL